MMFLWCFSLVLIVIAVAVVSNKQVVSIAVVSCMLPSVIVVDYVAYAVYNTVSIVVYFDIIAISYAIVLVQLMCVVVLLY